LGGAGLTNVRNLERDFLGYGQHFPVIEWPHKARIAVQIVVNYEEGAEMSVEKGDPGPEQFGDFPPVDLAVRDLGLESVFEYASRIGVWRMLDLFDRYDVKTTFFACGEALERNPLAAREIVRRGHEVCAHGYRWYDHFRWTEEQTREDIRKAVEAITQTTGVRPVGWYCREPSVHVRRLLVEEGGFLYDSDAYNDEIPYYVSVGGKDHLVVPYTSDCNDFHYWMSKFGNSDQFYAYLRDSFDVLYEEGRHHPRMMSLGLHIRISSKPGRIVAIEKFLRHARSFPDVWFAQRKEIAEWWWKRYPP
jgi:peptidoglycan/xylan/chitin deacetylase (PgdA/CDA1 family)